MVNFKVISLLLLVFSSLALADGSLFKELPNGMRVAILPNGVQVVVVPLNIGTTIVRARVARGFADEAVSTDSLKNEAGITHLLEHLLFLGTRSFPELDADLNKNGIRTNANTDWDETNYYEIGNPDTLPTMIKTQASMLGEPLLRDKDIKDETRPVTEELAMRSQNPYVDLIWLSLAAHARSRGAHLMAGGIDEVKAVAPQTVRDVYNRLYSADNMTVVVIGGTGDDLEATQKLIADEYGKIAKHASPAPVSLQSEFMPGAGEAQELVKIHTDVPGRRLLNLQFPLANTGKTEHAAILLKRLLNRKGPGTALSSLFEKNLVTNAMVDVDSYRDQTFLRVVFDMTMAGEAKVGEIMETVSSVFGTIAKNGLTDDVLNEMKLSYAMNHASGEGLMEVAEEISKGVEKYGLENLDAHAKLVLGVTGDEIKEVASRLQPEAAQPTMITPTAKGKPSAFLGRDVEIAAMSPYLPKMRAAFDAAAAKISTERNPFLHSDEPRPYGDKKSSLIFVVPSSDASKVEAQIEFSYSRALTADQRMAADMALEAFKLEPKNAQLFDQIAEAGIELGFRFNPGDMSLAITAEGESNGATQALYQLLEALRGYQVSPESFERAKALFIKQLEELPATEVSQQALIIGLNRLMGNDTVDLTARLARARAVDVAAARKAFSKSQESWAVKGVLAGAWSDAALVQTVPLLLPQKGEPLEQFKHDARLAPVEHPELTGRIAQQDRQGVARLYPVEVQQYSEDYWAFEIFARMLSKRLMGTVRTEMGLAYDVEAGFQALPTGGAALYLVGDTSQHAFKMAMGYSVTLDDVLNGNVLTADDFNMALADGEREISGELSGALGVYNSLFEGMNPKDIQAKFQDLTLEKVLATVRTKLEGSKKIDSVAVGAKDPVCQNLLTQP